MISRLANIISEKLLRAQVIEEADRELYVYGFFILLSQGIYFCLTALFGFLFGTLWENIVFYIMFSILRGYAGGFHASSESTCAFLTIAALFFSSVGIYVLEETAGVYVSLVLILLGGIVIFQISPLDSKEKPLSDDERREYRKKSIEILVFIVSLAFCGAICSIFSALYAASTSIALEGCLLLVAKAKKDASISI